MPTLKATAAPTAPAPFVAGQAVTARWTDGRWYPATVDWASASVVHVTYTDDGIKQVADLIDVRPVINGRTRAPVVQPQRAARNSKAAPGPAKQPGLGVPKVGVTVTHDRLTATVRWADLRVNFTCSRSGERVSASGPVAGQITNAEFKAVANAFTAFLKVPGTTNGDKFESLRTRLTSAHSFATLADCFK